MPLSLLRKRLYTSLKENCLYIIFVCGCLFCASAAFFYIKQKIYLTGGSDIFYYMSVADSYFNSGSLRNLTCYPSSDISTPQNGIVFIHYILNFLCLSPQNKLVAIIILYLLLHISSTFPIIKIAQRVGVKDTVSIGGLVGIWLFSWHILDRQLLPCNDCVFVTGTMWLVFLLIKFEESTSENSMTRPCDDGNSLNDLDSPKPSLFSSSTSCVLVAIGILSIILPHFRVNTVLVLSSFSIATILVRRYKLFAFSCVPMILSIASLVVFYAFLSWTDSPESASTTKNIAAPFYLWKSGTSMFMDMLKHYDRLYNLFDTSLPLLVFQDLGTKGNVLYLFLLASTICAFWQGCVRRFSPPVFLSLIIASACAFTLCLPYQPYRYLIYIYPFLYILGLRWNITKTITLLFMAASVLVSIALLAYYLTCGYTRTDFDIFFYKLDSVQKQANKRKIVYTTKPRQCYYIFENPCRFMPTKNDFRDDDIEEIHIVGDKVYYSDVVGRLKNLFPREGVTLKFEDVIETKSFKYTKIKLIKTLLN